MLSSAGKIPSGELEFTIGLTTAETSKHNSIRLFIRFFHSSIEDELLILLNE